jgi:thiamine-phosphate pyrophosphorylase
VSTRAPLPFPPGVYALCDDGVRTELALEEKARLLVEGGVRVLQLRMKRTPWRESVRVARAIAGVCRERGVVCLVNDRADLALLAGAHGVHVGDEDLPAEDARKLLGPDRLLGVTVRGLEGAQEAQRAGADYVGLGPIFATATKVVNAPVLGLAGLTEVARASPLPVVAISGISLDNIEQVAAAGAYGAAVLSDVLQAPDLTERARLLGLAFEKGARRRSL